MESTFDLSDIEIDSFTVNKLRYHLQKLKAKLCGNKEELRDRLKALISRETEFPRGTDLSFDRASEELQEKRKIFDLSNLSWTTTSTLATNIIPNGFSFKKISSFFKSSSNIAQDEDDEIDFSTEKPSTKGRKMYLSEKIHHWEYSQNHNTYSLFRANCEASFRTNVWW